ncbi:unnamed protein product [Ostreobium quekettii]|uniref:Uncharacterized protein n=1 Tax=Ostreobium quekettii TaxID=121088 RepID=A0A8S1IZV9_9CHLO|nr:unnamed protein product [Ostreobium quekettii]
MADDPSALLAEERAYSSRLAQKVQEQAAELKRQADELEWAAEQREVANERLQEVDPLFFDKGWGAWLRVQLRGNAGRRAVSPVRDLLKPRTNPSHIVSALAQHRSALSEASDRINKKGYRCRREPAT